MKYCRLCRVTYPDSYNYCPNHGTRFWPREQRGTQQCPSCGHISENHHAFCANCGTDRKSQPSPDVSNKTPTEVYTAPPPKIEARIAQSGRKEDSTSANSSATIQANYAVEPPEEMLTPRHDARGHPEQYRKRLYGSLPPDIEEDSSAETWFDSDGQEEPKRARTAAGRDPETQWTSRPPETGQLFSAPPRAPARRKARGTIAKITLLSLVVVVGLFALTEIYEIDTPESLALLLRHLPADYVRRPELLRSPDSVPLKQPERQDAVRDEDSSGLGDSPFPKIENSLQESGKATKGNTKSALALDKSSAERDAGESRAARRKTIEHEIDKAIHQRAVEGVVVAFVNDTAYLTGAVLSENQKAAAEQAASNVPGVKRVRSSIAVRWENG